MCPRKNADGFSLPLVPCTLGFGKAPGLVLAYRTAQRSVSEWVLDNPESRKSSIVSIQTTANQRSLEYWNGFCRLWFDAADCGSDKVWTFLCDLTALNHPRRTIPALSRARKFLGHGSSGVFVFRDLTVSRLQINLGVSPAG